VKFGLGLPLFANPGIPYFRTPNFEELSWKPIADAVQRAEAWGLDSIWVADHMFLGRDGAILEGWTALSVVAGLTERVRLGTIHLGNGFRHPPLTAKMVATLDWISGGRVEFFFDPGWREREHTAYGFQWEPDRAVRVARTREALEICELMWTGESVSYDGRFYSIKDAICTPPPRQPNGPRVWLGEALDDESLGLIAERADVWNSVPASVRLLKDKIARVDRSCELLGRDPATLVKTLETQVLVYRDRRDAEVLFERFAALRSQHPSGDAMTDVMAFFREVNPQLESYERMEDFYDEFVIGTPDEGTEKLSAYRDLGIDEVICWFMDFPDPTSMERLATEVIPRFRN